MVLSESEKAQRKVEIAERRQQMRTQEIRDSEAANRQSVRSQLSEQQLQERRRLDLVTHQNKRQTDNQNEVRMRDRSAQQEARSILDDQILSYYMSPRNASPTVKRVRSPTPETNVTEFWEELGSDPANIITLADATYEKFLCVY